MRLATLPSVLMSAVLLAAPAGAAGAAEAPSLPKVKEQVIAHRSAKVQLGSPQASGEYVGWLEERRGGGIRLAVSSSAGVRRTAWLGARVNTLRFHRGVDARTGKVAVRAELWRCGASRDCTLRLTLNPRSLRRSSIRWADEPASGDYWYGTGIGAIVDGETQLTYRDTPEPRPPLSGDFAYVSLMRPTGCDLRDVRAQLHIPVLHDCGSMWVSVRGGLVAVRADVPSQTLEDHYSTSRRLDVLDLRAATPTWRQIGSGGYGKGGSSGVQSTCLLGDAIVVLTGSQDFYGGPMPKSWKLTVLPLRAGGPSWQAAAPQLVNAEYFALACTSRGVYALNSRTRHLVRLVRPKGAPRAGLTVDSAVG